jgi:3-dehydroquinate dehydratase type I
MINQKIQKQIPYCLPVIQSSKALVLSMIQNNLTDYTFFEVWLDYIEDLDQQMVQDLIDSLEGRLVLVFRRLNLEPVQMKKEQTMAVLSYLAETDVLVDLDIDDQKEMLSELKKTGFSLKTIISYHNYTKTPELSELQEIVAFIEDEHPTIIKIATLCQDETDAVRLLDLLGTLKKKKKKYIILGMGQYGAATRIFATLWGNEMIFAPANDSEESAPGQLTREKLETIFKAITE